MKRTFFPNDPSLLRLPELIAIIATIFALLGIASMAKGQDIPYTKAGVGWNPAGPFYSDDGRYVIWQSDFGYFWLDTVNLIPGHVQAEAKCGFPVQSQTNYFAVGDCNGIASVRTSGGLAEAIAAGGNCSAKPGCPPTGNTATRWIFTLPNVNFKASNSSSDDIPIGRRIGDSQGRIWVLQFIAAGSFNWHGTPGGPTPTFTPTITGTPPTPTATVTPGLPTATPTSTVTGRPTPIPTTCSDVQAPWGRVGPFLNCYDCAGNFVPQGIAPPNPVPGQPCLLKGGTTATPTKTATASGGGGGTPITPFTPTHTLTPTPTPGFVCVTTTPQGARVVPFRTPQ